ncbi:MAG TPA: anti-sigma factor [Chthoniobacterales bacterium]
MAGDVNSRFPDDDRHLLVHAYLDGELDVASVLTAKQEIDGDAALTGELANITALQAKLRDTFAPEAVPPTLRARIGQITKTRRGWDRPTWMGMAASVALAAMLSSASTWLVLRPNTDAVSDEIVDTHVRALLSAKPTDVTSSDRHTVKPWFSTRLPIAPRVTDLASEGFPLLGGRIDVVSGSPVPTLVYGRRLHVISLTAMPAQAGIDMPTSHASQRGFNIISWTDGDTRFWAASDLNMGELDSFVKLVRSHA